MFESRRCSMIDVLGSHISRKQFYEPYNFDAFVSGGFGKMVLGKKVTGKNVTLENGKNITGKKVTGKNATPFS